MPALQFAIKKMMNIPSSSLSSIILLLSTFVITTNATTLTPHTTAKKYTCQSSDVPPGRQISLSSDRGTDESLYILIPPLTTNEELCTITKCNNLVECKVYIPIAKSYVGALTPTTNPADSEYIWQVSSGKYETITSIECGAASTSGGTGDTAWNADEYLCQIKLPQINSDEDGYYLSMFTLNDYYEAVSGNGGSGGSPNVKDLTLASRFLERVNWGPSEYMLFCCVSFWCVMFGLYSSFEVGRGYVR